MPDPRNVWELFGSVAARLPNQPAVEVQREDGLDRFTYGNLARMAETLAVEFSRLGLGRGDRAAILAPNDAHWCAAYLAVARAGGVAVPLDTAYKPAQIAALLADCSPRLIVTVPPLLSGVRKALGQAGSTCRPVLLHGEDDGMPAVESWLTAPPAPERTPLPLPATAPPDPAVILYTSGTTSDPKGVVLTHGNLLAEVDAVFKTIQVDERDTVLGVLPLFHALAQMANLLLPLAVGARVVFLQTVNTTELLRALRERSVTAFCCVPQFFYLIHQRVMHEVRSGGRLKRSLFHALLALNGWLRDRLRVNLGRVLFGRVHAVLGPRMRLLVTGGSRFDPAVGHDLYKLGFSIQQAYGLTECSGGAVVTRPGDHCIEAVGQPLNGVEVRILAPSDSDERAGPGGTSFVRDAATPEGEVAIRGPIVMASYYNRPDATAAALVDGWLHTGDLGVIDRDGRLYITGRKKEVIVLSSGKNIYPEEIEAHYAQSPFIKELCVMGLTRPDEPAAERLYAVIVPDLAALQQRKVVNIRELIRFEVEGLSVGLPSHKRILGYEIRTEDLPRTTTRKLRRFEIEREVRARGDQGRRDTPQRVSEADALWATGDAVRPVLEAITRSTGIASLRPDASLELDLGLDSMERVELLTELEQRFSVSVPEEISQGVFTVRDLVAAVSDRASSGDRGARAGDPWRQLLASVPEDDPALVGLLAPKTLRALLAFGLVRLALVAARVSVRVDARGIERLPRSGAFLLCPNHESYLDPFVLIAALPFSVFRRLFFVGASEYFDTPFMQRLARAVNVVPVDPDANLLRAMQAGAYGLRHGKVLILFPEGERSIDGEVKRFKKGAPILSTHLRAPIVPVALRGLFAIWPRNRPINWRALRPWAATRVRVRFGDPLAPPGETHPGEGAGAASEADYAVGADRLRQVVVRMWMDLVDSRQLTADS